MKRIFFLLGFIAIAFIAKSQTQDTSWHNITACKISTISNGYDGSSVNHVGILINNDDLKTSADLIYIFYDANQVVRFQGTYHITGTTYTNWNHTFAQTYTVVGTHFGLTYQ